MIHRPALHAVLGLGCCLGTPTFAQSSPQPPLLTADQALRADAAGYANLYRIDPGEAFLQLSIQESSVAATDALAVEFADRLAGISIRRSSGGFAIVALLTGETAVAPRILKLGQLGVALEFETGARMTRRAAVIALGRNLFSLRRMFPPGSGFGYDQRTGAIVALVRGGGEFTATDEDRRVRAETLLGLPVRLARAGDFTLDGLPGGSQLTGIREGRRFRCTAGFVVTDGQRTAISTAAHCPDTLAATNSTGAAVDLPMIGAWGAGYQDVQVNATGGGDPARFFSDRHARVERPLDTWRNRASTRAGDVVCRWGESSGYSCGEVEMVDFAPPAELCAGTCPATWVMFRSPRCAAGDSGGPLFVATTAIGLMKASNRAPDGRCLFSLYMSTDYLPPAWRLLTTRTAAR